ncbi:TadE/TadG family type IV pilus assembly protein [Helcococcus ovis]|uniref:TadE/TadG family type IV pilus assembly protein n=1 Tax=Helcococcus ovis TaxID=72026 RepID=UPI0014320999|nr:TadE family protein [Helcococcus ovis]WNZ00772.1 pilus assembly protein [Helcococcus ovis]
MLDKLFKFKKSEKGQGMVEFALVFPMFIFICLFIIEVGWIAYNYISFDYTYRVASWELRPNYSNEEENPRGLFGYEVKELIYDKLKENGLSTSGIEIKDATITFNTKIENVVEINGRKEQERKYYMEIKGNMTKEVPLITPVGKMFMGSNLPLTKKLDKLRLLESKAVNGK